MARFRKPRGRTALRAGIAALLLFAGGVRIASIWPDKRPKASRRSASTFCTVVS